MNRRELLILGAGAAIAWPLAGRAQQKAIPVIGFLGSTSPGPYAPFVAALRQGLSETGYVEGQNVAIEYRWAEGSYERLPELAEDLVRRRVHVVAATGGLVTALAAKAATSTIPIVFAMGDDPVAEGVVTSFARPGGNLTGVSFFVIELGAKLIDLAVELIPNSAPIAILANPNRPSYKAVHQTLEDAARVKGRQLLVLDASHEKDLGSAFASLARSNAGALVVTSDPLFLDRRERLVALAAQYSVPTVYAWRAFVAAGGLMSYGINLAGEYRKVGMYIGKILSGERPTDLPVQQPTRFELVINLKTAKAQGLTVPQTLLIRADEVIE